MLWRGLAGARLSIGAAMAVDLDSVADHFHSSGLQAQVLSLD
jgi:hypothetical protein